MYIITVVYAGNDTPNYPYHGYVDMLTGNAENIKSTNKIYLVLLFFFR